jgi:hypothetical protein
LSRYYAELSGTNDTPQPMFSLARTIAEMRTERGLHDGYEREVCGGAATINLLANALHRVFSAPDADADGTRARLRAACIDYLALGGPHAAGPIGLLAGLTPQPTVLILHFFAVAAHATAAALLPWPSPARLRRGYDLLHVACLILMPLLADERVAGWSAPPLLALVNLIFPWRSKELEE